MAKGRRAEIILIIDSLQRLKCLCVVLGTREAECLGCSSKRKLVIAPILVFANNKLNHQEKLASVQLINKYNFNKFLEYWKII